MSSSAHQPLQLPGLASHAQSSTSSQLRGGVVVGGDGRPMRHAPPPLHVSHTMIGRALPPLTADAMAASPPAGTDNATTVASTSARSRLTHPQALYTSSNQPQPYAPNPPVVGAGVPGPYVSQRRQQTQHASGAPSLLGRPTDVSPSSQYQSSQVSPPKTLAAEAGQARVPPLHVHNGAIPCYASSEQHSVAPLSVPQLIGELMQQNQLLECRLVADSATGGDSASLHQDHYRSAPPPRQCRVCDEFGEGDPSRRAIYHCQECQQLGLPFEFCEACWADEHRSRRMRDHRRSPLPLIVVCPHEGDASSSSAATTNAIDARAVLTLQQHVLQLLLNVMPKSTRECPTQTEAAATEGDIAARRRLSAGQSASSTIAAHQHELHTLQLEERCARAELDATCRSEILELALQHRNFFVAISQVYSLAAIGYDASRVSTLTDDANVRGVTSNARIKDTNTAERSAAASGLPPRSPLKDDAGVGAAPKAAADVAEDFVTVVHGEKHLPGQKHMLLVRFHSGAEDWVPAAAVQHHAAVLLYMRRKGTPDPAASGARPAYRLPPSDVVSATPPRAIGSAPVLGRELSPIGAFEAEAGLVRYESKLGDTERQELAEQLASLQRLGTAGSAGGGLASRGSLLAIEEFGPPPPGRAGAEESSDDDHPADTDAASVPAALMQHPVALRATTTVAENRTAATDPVDAEVAAHSARGDAAPALIASQRNTPRRPNAAVTFSDHLHHADEHPTAPAEEHAQPQPGAAMPSTPPPQPHQRPQPASDAPVSTYVTWRKAQEMQQQQNHQSSDDAAAAAAALKADEDVVKQYEQRVRLIEERQRQVRKMREEQEERLKQLRDKQQAKDEENRKKIHAEYESQAALLKQEQPDVEHPLYLTNDRHAALLLHKLHEEIASAEREKAAREEYRAGVRIRRGAPPQLDTQAAPPPPPAE